MTDAGSRFHPPGPTMIEDARLGGRWWDRALPLALGLWGWVAALVVGLAVGNPSPSAFSLAVGVSVLAVLTVALARPFVAYLGVAASAIMLVIVVLPSGKGLNLFDLLLPPLLVAAALGAMRQRAAEGDDAESSDRHEAIRRARRRFSRATVIYFGVVVLSIVPMFFDGRAANGTSSLLALIRAFEGLLLFPLGLWLLRGERRIRLTLTMMLAASVLLLAVNVVARVVADVKRAGLSWYVNYPPWPISDPNECAAGMLLVIVILIARQAVRPQGRNLVLACGALVLLVLTFSRSGLLALIAVAAMLLPRARWRWILAGGLIVAAVLPLVPSTYWERLAHTVVMQRGTFDTFSSLIRFLTWKTALTVFLHHPVLGVGYLGLENVSYAYNDMRVKVGAESYFLEIAADVGILGLTAMGFVIARLFQLGRTIRRVTPPGSLGHEMATLHTPLVIGLLIASLTGSNFVGMVGLGQLALWCVLMIRAGHEALAREAAPAPRMSAVTPE